MIFEVSKRFNSETKSCFLSPTPNNVLSCSMKLFLCCMIPAICIVSNCYINAIDQPIQFDCITEYWIVIRSS